MPAAREVLNGFTVAEVREISGVSVPMIDYLNRHEYLRPAYSRPDNPRGRVRYYSFRDLVIARLIQRLRDAGVQLGRLKEAVGRVAQDNFWQSGLSPFTDLEWLLSDGRDCHFCDNSQLVSELMETQRRSFAFLVNMHALVIEVRDSVPPAKRKHFTMANAELRFASRTESGRA